MSSENMLPPGSTSVELQDAINNSVVGDVIIISDDMPFSAMVIIAAGTDITIKSSVGNNWVMSSPGTKIRHFDLKGSLALQDITLDGENNGGGVTIVGGNLTMNAGAVLQNCKSSISGGGINVKNGILAINQGAVVQNCYSTGSGGGAYINPNGTIIINGGTIRDNKSEGAGAGMMFQESTLNMTAGEFLNNKSNASGGAIQTLGKNTINISGGIIKGNTSGFQGGGIGISVGASLIVSNLKISENTAKSNGGGLFIQGTATMSGVSISENTAGVRGGGIYCYANGRIEITDESYITKNNAPNGGGIYTAAATYNNLITGDDTVFRCNWASAAYEPPINASTLYPDIQFANTSITDHPINNFDVNHTVGTPIEIYFKVTYDANDGIGSHIGPDTVPGKIDTILLQSETGISRPGYLFSEWNTQPDGTGNSYNPGDPVILGCDMALFAQWVAEPKIYSVTYNSNGGSGNYIDHCSEFDLNYRILSTTQTSISRVNFLFTDWNTYPNGNGISYSPGALINVNSDMALYAQWKQFPIQKKMCRTTKIKSRRAIEGQKLWVDGDNAGNTRPPSVEIILLRDGIVYKRVVIDSVGDGYFGFCCLPVWKNPTEKYDYQVDESAVPGYAKTINCNNIINTLL